MSVSEFFLDCLQNRWSYVVSLSHAEFSLKRNRCYNGHLNNRNNNVMLREEVSSIIWVEHLSGQVLWGVTDKSVAVH